MAIYSRKYNSIFFHVPKSARSSIRKTLLTYYASAVEHTTHHALPSDVASMIGKSAYDCAFRFAFVRNPWGRAVSLYHYLLMDESNPTHHLTKNLTFAEYLDVYNNKTKHRQRHWTHNIQQPAASSQQPALIVDFVGRFESLRNDWNEILRELKINNPAQLPVVNRSVHKPYWEYFTSDAMVESVKESRKLEIELFNYKFMV